MWTLKSNIRNVVTFSAFYDSLWNWSMSKFRFITETWDEYIDTYCLYFYLEAFVFFVAKYS